jgi:hypothetical protein
MVTQALGGPAVQNAMASNPWPAVIALTLLATLATIRYCYRLWIIHDLLKQRPKDRIMLRGGLWRFVIEFTPTESEEPSTNSGNVIPLRTPRTPPLRIVGTTIRATGQTEETPD